MKVLGRRWEAHGKAMARRVSHRSESRRRWEGGGKAWEGGGEVARWWEARCGEGLDMTAVRLGRRQEGCVKVLGRRWEAHGKAMARHGKAMAMRLQPRWEGVGRGGGKAYGVGVSEDTHG